LISSSGSLLALFCHEFSTFHWYDFTGWLPILLTSPLSQKNFAARLKRRIFDSFQIKWYTVSFSWKKKVAGEVWTWSDDTIRFFIFKRRFIFNSFAPRLEGVISSSKNDTVSINARFSIRHLVEMLLQTIFAVGLIIYFLFLSAFARILHENLFELLLATGVLVLLIIVDGIIELQYLEKFIKELASEISFSNGDKAEIEY
jgi:hypothetical protein